MTNKVMSTDEPSPNPKSPYEALQAVSQPQKKKPDFKDALILLEKGEDGLLRIPERDKEPDGSLKKWSKRVAETSNAQQNKEQKGCIIC